MAEPKNLGYGNFRGEIVALQAEDLKADKATPIFVTQRYKSSSHMPSLLQHAISHAKISEAV